MRCMVSDVRQQWVPIRSCGVFKTPVVFALAEFPILLHDHAYGETRPTRSKMVE